MPKMIIPSCTACGACCVATEDREWWAELNNAEMAAGPFAAGRHLHRFTVPTGNPYNDQSGIRTTTRVVRHGPLRGQEVCACTLLEGVPLLHVQCRYYNDRPKVCRQFRPGSSACVQAYRWLRDAAL